LLEALKAFTKAWSFSAISAVHPEPLESLGVPTKCVERAPRL